MSQIEVNVFFLHWFHPALLQEHHHSQARGLLQAALLGKGDSREFISKVNPSESWGIIALILTKRA